MEASESTELEKQFPLGAAVAHADLETDPYAVYARLRDTEPVSWLPIHQMYYVTRHDLCCNILCNDKIFTVGFEHSTVLDIFGPHMMSVDGPDARRYKNAHRRSFMPGYISDTLEPLIRKNADRLIDGFAAAGRVELRKKFASRLPILTMLDLFGLSSDTEEIFRGWYDAFEGALANTLNDEGVRARGKQAVKEFHVFMQQEIVRTKSSDPGSSLLSSLVHSPMDRRLSDAEIRHNALIVMFGGISTVEALILNAIYALSTHPVVFDSLRAGPGLLPKVIEETVRWLGPVQSAHRCVAQDTVVAGVYLPKGSVISCALAAANHDPEVFENPGRFDIDRDQGKHVGFATGPHLCLGMHLARAEGRIALERLITRLEGFTTDPQQSAKPFGAEFRQPPALHIVWASNHH